MSSEFVWHRDDVTRYIRVLAGTGWQFQLDDELPFLLKKNHNITIPKGIFHRIYMAGVDELVVRIRQ
jgi:hypothetical protein